MRTLAIRIVPALLLSLGLGSVAARAQEPRLAWTLRLEDPGEIVAAAWSPTASCVVVGTQTSVHVIDVSGRRLWGWNFHATNRWIRLDPFTSIAVSPRCDAVVLGGSAAYKYVWTADRHGRRGFFGTVGTPLSARFDLRGDAIAVVTGASLGYLLSPRLAVRWAGELGALPVRWPSQSPEPPGAGSVDFSREDVEALFGALVWGYGVSDGVSDDGEWRAVWTAPFRGSGTGTIELWGPGAGGYRGRYARAVDRSQPRWSKPMGCPSGELTRDGAFVVATGDPDHPDAENVGDSRACDSGELSTYVFDRDGNTVLTWPHDQDPGAMPAAVFERTGRRIEVPGTPAWDAPLTAAEASSAPDARRRLAYGPGRRLLLVGRGRELRVYRAPE